MAYQPAATPTTPQGVRRLTTPVPRAPTVTVTVTADDGTVLQFPIATDTAESIEAAEIDQAYEAIQDHAERIDDLLENGVGGAAAPAFDTLIGDGINGVITFTHNLGRIEYSVDVAELTADGEEPVNVRVRRRQNTTVVGPFASIPTPGQYRVILR